MSHEFENATGRREFIQGGAAVMGALLTSSVPAVAECVSKPKRPNLLLFRPKVSAPKRLASLGIPS
jgi:hypothetical protein